MARILRGDIIWADLNPARGHEQAGQRPVVVLSHDVFNERSGTVIAPRAVLTAGHCVDESGVPVMLRPKWLVVPPELAPMAREILGSQFKPYTSDNEINVIQQYGLDGLIVSHYLTLGNGVWFVLADKGEHDMQFFWREKFSTDASDDFDTGDGKMKGYMRCAASWGDWRGVWGSPGV